MSMARLTFPSRLELKSLAGSFKAAPLKKVSLTTNLYDSPVQMSPSWDHTGVPIHFHSSTNRGRPLDEGAHPCECLASPVAQIGNPFAYQLRGRRACCPI